MSNSGKVAVVTGANRGIGLAVVEALCERMPSPDAVYLTSRDDVKGQEALSELEAKGLSPKYHQLDVTNDQSVEKFADYLKLHHGGIDVLINNAGVFTATTPYNTYEEANRIIDINYRSALRLEKYLYPLLRENASIVNISSDCGHLSNLRNKQWIERLSKKDLKEEDIEEFITWYIESVRTGTFNKDDFVDEGTYVAYRVSKIALSALTAIRARKWAEEGSSRRECSLHPGLVRTGMTLGIGFYSPEQAAQNVVSVALDRPGLNGAYIWYDGRVLDWYDHTADYYFKRITLEIYKK